MRKLLDIAWHSVLMRLSDGGLLLAVVVAPLFVSVLVNLALGDIVLGRGVPETQLQVAVANEDVGGQCGNLGAAFAQVLLPGPDSPEPYTRLFVTRSLEDAAAARRLVEQGKLVAALAIPPDFSQSLSARGDSAVSSRGATVEVYVDGREEILGAAFASAIRTCAAVISVGEVALATTTDVLMSHPVTRSKLQAGAYDEQLADLVVQAARPEANPVQIAVAARPQQGHGVRLTHYFAATIAIVLVGLFTLMTSASLYQEKARGTLQRAYVTPTHPATILWGKTLGAWVAGLLLMAVLVAGMAAVEWLLGRGGEAPDGLGLAALALATVTAATGFGVAVAGACRTYGQVASYGRALIIIMGLIGGIFLPAALLPAPVSWFSRLTYQYWAMDGYLKLVVGGHLGSVLPQVAVLLVMGGLGTAGGSALLRRRIAVDR